MIPLESHKWNSIPGEESLTLYPIIRKIDLVSSNSYLIASPDRLILIDPGGLSEQADEIITVIRAKEADGGSFSGIFLTHTHIDHSHSLIHHPGLTKFAEATYAHRSGVDALRNMDYGITQAGLLRQELRCTLLGHSLFSTEERRGEYDLAEESVTFSGEHTITAYHTPGHSPDSICYQIKKILFIGDILFAGAPGIAGIVGYSRDELLRSLHGLRLLIHGEEIEICLTGHGNPIPAESVVQSISAIIRDVEQLNEIAAITPEWAKNAAFLAEDLMAKIDETLTVISGRIVFISHMLEELEEGDFADQISSIIDSSAIDDLLTRYHQFSSAYQLGAYRDIELLQMAGSISGKLERLVDRGNLGGVIEPYLIDHLEELINDYMAVFRGYQPVTSLTTASPEEICEEIIDSLSYRNDPPTLPDSDSDIAFLSAIAKQMGRVQVVMDGSVQIISDEDFADAIMDPARFERALRTLLLQYAAIGSGWSKITIDSPDPDHIRITIATDRPISDERMKRYCIQAFLLSGGYVQECSDQITISYPQNRRVI